MKMRKLLYVLIALMMIFPVYSFDFTPAHFDTAIVYYNSACGSCTEYLNSDVLPLLDSLGVKDIVMKDYVNDQANRAELIEKSDALGVPPKLQGHFTIMIDDKLILEGHVPKEIITDLFRPENQDRFEKILVYQDEMTHGDELPTSYKIWAFAGEPKEYAYAEPIETYLSWYDSHKSELSKSGTGLYESGKLSLLPLVLATGFFDGFNPCAFAVLLFFIAFLFTIKRTKAAIFKMGVVYIIAIYLAYLLIGLGLLKAIVVFSDHHFMAKLGSYMVIALGILNLLSYFFPNIPLPKIPKVAKSTLLNYMQAATLPAAFILGFLVGLCTFPCSGGVYVAILGLLAAHTTYAQGFIYLLLYNVMFVLPLVIILVMAANKKVTEKLTEYEQSKSSVIRLASGILMIVLGLVILVWFV